VAVADVEAERWNYEERRRRLVAELKSAYFDYLLAERSLDIVIQDQALLEQLRSIAETRFSVGKGVQQDVVRVQLELSLLIERRSLLEQQITALAARINGMLARPSDTPVPATLAFDMEPVPASLAGLQDNIRDHNAAVQRDDRLVDRGQLAFSLARRDLLPDFALNVTTQKKVAGMPWMYGVDFMVKVPVYFQRKQRPMIAEAAAALESARHMRESTVTTVAARVAEEYVAATTSQRLVTLYTDSVLPQARLALESSLASYQVGAVDFLTLLNKFSMVPTPELTYQYPRTRLRQALVRLEALVGTEFVK
jgi:outer membrane protein TolC